MGVSSPAASGGERTGVPPGTGSTTVATPQARQSMPVQGPPADAERGWSTASRRMSSSEGTSPQHQHPVGG